MAKKAAPKAGKAKPSMSPEEHRKQGQILSARARLHHAKADMLEAKNPPKRDKGRIIGY